MTLCIKCYDVDDIARQKPIWCACTYRDPEALNSRTLCGMVVTLPGEYETRAPTCPDCRAKAAAGMRPCRREVRVPGPCPACESQRQRGTKKATRA